MKAVAVIEISEKIFKELSETKISNIDIIYNTDENGSSFYRPEKFYSLEQLPDLKDDYYPDGDDFDNGYVMGWNMCLKQILNES